MTKSARKRRGKPAHGRRLSTAACNREERQTASPARYAFVVSLCNITDYYGKGGEMQLDRALRLKRTLHAVGSTIDTIAFVHGYSAHSITRLRTAGWDVRDMTAIDVSGLLQPILEPMAG